MDNLKKLILIEDDDLIRPLYKETLEEAGFKVSDYPLGKLGLEALKIEQFDIMLLDIMLPDTNGLEVLRQIKQDPKLKDLKVVMLTNLGQDSIIKEAFKLGAEGYLIKSAYNPDQFVEEVKKLAEA